jgi:aryl-alcohol dehydrogenase-like predicted oxidoreductase
VNKVRLGRSDLVVSRIGLGGLGFGDPGWRPWVLDEDAARPIIRRALESGITFFDTANAYSLGVGEVVIGKLLREHAKRDEIVIATKVGLPMGPSATMRGLSREHIVEQCEASLTRLGIETIDLYQVHRFDPKTELEESLEALARLVRQGKVRYIGASSTWAWRFHKCLSISERRGWARFVSMQNHYNLLYREEEREMIPLCLEEDIAVLPWSPLARGLLARDAGQRTIRAAVDVAMTNELYDHPDDVRIVDANRTVARARGVSPAQTALGWLLGCAGVTAPIVGASSIAQLDELVGAAELTLTPDERAALEAPYTARAVRGWL